MKTAVVSVVALAGLAAAANAQVVPIQGEAALSFQVRLFQDGQAANDGWASSVVAAPGSRVEIRARVSWLGGSATPAALSGAIFQPTVSNWNAAVDNLQDSNTTPGVGGGVGNFIQSGGGVAGGVTEDSGNYGRIVPFSFAGLGTTAALRGHVNNVAGVNYLRIAQNSATNWAGIGTSTTAANNVSGAWGVPCVQKSLASVVPGVDPDSVLGITNIVVFKFAINIGDVAGREVMDVSAPATSIRQIDGAARGFTWFASTNANTATIGGAVTVNDAQIIIPAPGALALLGLGGLVAGRRRR